MAMLERAGSKVGLTWAIFIESKLATFHCSYLSEYLKKI